jgi:hypothetical protein
LLIQNVFNGRRQTGTTKNPKFIAGNKKGREKREALYMIPMNMAEQNCPFYGHLFHERHPQVSNTGPRINDDQLITATDFNTSRITPNTRCPLAR